MADDDSADAIVQWADVLLPGDALFPAASASGMAELLLARLRGFGDGTLARRLHSAITAAGGPLASLSRPARQAVVAKIAASEPKLFNDVRKIAYIAYYEQESVVAAIRALGTPYHWAPLPEGYAAEAFDAAIDAPKHRRGGWTPTEDVVPLDLASLDHLRRET